MSIKSDNTGMFWLNNSTITVKPAVRNDILIIHFLDQISNSNLEISTSSRATIPHLNDTASVSAANAATTPSPATPSASSLSGSQNRAISASRIRFLPRLDSSTKRNTTQNVHRLYGAPVKQQRARKRWRSFLEEESIPHESERLHNSPLDPIRPSRTSKTSKTAQRLFPNEKNSKGDEKATVQPRIRINKRLASLDKKIPQKSRKDGSHGTPRNQTQNQIEDVLEMEPLDGLRALVKTCVNNMEYRSAFFYADKLVTLSAQNPEDVFLLAKTCFLNAEYHRTLLIVKRFGLMNASTQPLSLYLDSAILYARGMLAVQQFEECIEVLTSEIPSISLREVEAHTHAPTVHSGSKSLAVLATLIGQAWKSLGNRENAIVYYRFALGNDAGSHEAFRWLFQEEMLSSEEQAKLLAELDLSKVDPGQRQCNQILYWTHTNKETSDLESLQDNNELKWKQAQAAYDQYDMDTAFRLCTSLQTDDPYNLEIVPLFVAILMHFGKKRDLYQYSHEMVDIYPDNPASWYIVACYYFLIGKHDLAQRHFHKTITMDSDFAIAWVAFGHSFASQDESDQAMSCYRTARNILPGSCMPLLSVGIEYSRINQLEQALQSLLDASKLGVKDPLVLNEIGVVYYKQKRYTSAVESLQEALQACPNTASKQTFSVTLFNLASAYRKLGRYQEAEIYYGKAIALAPDAASYASLGLTYHVQGALDRAIECYHSALAYNPQDILALDMIALAMEEAIHVTPSLDDSLSSIEHDPLATLSIEYDMTP
uniref:Cell division cycle protein 16 putative n=1 Tax=Albugo laibachii Nc14 TaxID=890382 RepID=F0W256_9STRA|nr:cell division cycle protein 16 putative [Albugo laibachii Nc14]|eukprot:CCA15138.1 cell division cycle protein 16 putative [Albugo laibachii Nc14]